MQSLCQNDVVNGQQVIQLRRSRECAAMRCFFGRSARSFCCGSRLNHPDSDRKFWCMCPFTRVPYGGTFCGKLRRCAKAESQACHLGLSELAVSTDSSLLGAQPRRRSAVSAGAARQCLRHVLGAHAPTQLAGFPLLP